MYYSNTGPGLVPAAVELVDMFSMKNHRCCVFMFQQMQPNS